MGHRSTDLEEIFRSCFFERYSTVLVGGGDEPVYLPGTTDREGGGSGAKPHRIVYRADYFASALHEVAHWCLAGRERRQLEDYGYWYAPDGRTPQQQADFEAVEARPQALESLFAESCGTPFHLSADNLDGDPKPSASFARAVEAARGHLLAGGLPRRARVFREALECHYGGGPRRS